MSLVNVPMATAALGRADVENRVLAFGYVTLLALDSRVLPFERIRRDCMLLDRESRRLEAIGLVTRRAV